MPACRLSTCLLSVLGTATTLDRISASDDDEDLDDDDNDCSYSYILFINFKKQKNRRTELVDF